MGNAATGRPICPAAFPLWSVGNRPGMGPIVAIFLMKQVFPLGGLRYGIFPSYGEPMLFFAMACTP